MTDRTIASTTSPTPLRDRVIERRAVALSELSPHPDNWRRHPEAQRAAVAANMDRIGILGAALFNRRTGRLIDGHLRVDIARDRGEETFPADVVDLSAEEERVALATYDALTYLADVDEDALSRLATSVEADGDYATLLSAGDDAGSIYDRLLDLGGEDPETIAAGDLDEEPENYHSADMKSLNVSGRYQSQYAVIVMAASEGEQRRIYDKLAGEGYTVKVVVT